MARQLARLLECIAPRHRAPSPAAHSNPLFEDYLSDEVSEHDGVLLVRLGAGRAMQVRLGGSEILTRTVPMATATLVGEHPPWEIAPANCIQAWIQSNAAIWQWLVAKGIDVGETKSRLADSILTRHNALPV